MQNEAPGLFRFIQHFGFTYTEYEELLGTYIRMVKDDGSSVDYDEIACVWLNSPTTKREKDGTLTRQTLYQQKIDKLPQQGKPELYIGGIFPITGNKYKAPELATGKAKKMSVKN